MAAKATKPTTSTDPEKVVELQHDIRADSFVVSWDGDDDPQNPKNWSELRKWATVTLVATIAFIPYVLLPHNSRDAQKADGRIACSPFASSLIAPPINLVMEEFHSTSNVLSTLVVTIFMLGFAAGPLVISPLSEQYGRNIVFISTVIMHLLFTIACALSTGINMLIVFRFLAGCFGSAPITIGGGTITDIMPQEKRGKAMAIFIMGPTLGPSLGPIIGGYLAQAAGWRWVFWLLAIALGVMTAFTIIFLRETYAPKILARKANRLRKKTGDGRWRRTIGLVYIAIGVGLAAGLLILFYTSDRQMAQREAKSGERIPEYRLHQMLWASPFLAGGLLWYGWSADKNAHWIIPILGTVPVGLGIIFIFTPMSTYLLDAYPAYSASAIAASTVLRSLFSAILPLAGPPMYDHLGLGWGNSLLAFVALALGGVPLLFCQYGRRWREGSNLVL
ncbi:MAG: hypothetical protein L6R39_001343 [Caloplaca ligustica]|nr:MAG: hypothetical protein L6R39_001343 [Caloplaca ligustica]